MAVIRNDVQLACLPAISVTPQAAAGTVKILAVSTAKRSPYLPDVPTLKEAGIDVEADAWNGLIAPGGTPQPMVDKIKKDVVEIIRQPAVRERLAAQLMEPVGSTPEEFRARIDGEIARWAPVIKAENVKVNHYCHRAAKREPKKNPSLVDFRFAARNGPNNRIIKPLCSSRP